MTTSGSREDMRISSDEDLESFEETSLEQEPVSVGGPSRKKLYAAVLGGIAVILAVAIGLGVRLGDSGQPETPGSSQELSSRE